MALTAGQVVPTVADARRAAEAVAGSGVVRVLLYGSIARGEADEYSDIDLMVVFNDLDYACRQEVQRRLRLAAVEAAGHECSVHVTDLPEWENRLQVSSSFEREIAGDAVCLVSNGAEPVNWDKEMVRAMTNEQEALEKVRGEMLPSLQSLRRSAFSADEDEKDPAVPADEREEIRLNRVRAVCYHSSMLIEHSLKTLVVLQGKHPVSLKQLKRIGHNIDAALEQLEAPHRDSLQEAIRQSGISAETISEWRVQGTYPGDLDDLNDHADAEVDTYIHLSLSVAWTVLEEVEHHADVSGHTRALRRLLTTAVNSFQHFDVRLGTSLPTPDPSRPPAPIPPSV